MYVKDRKNISSLELDFENQVLLEYSNAQLFIFVHNSFHVTRELRAISQKTL